jgi:hypothetical protein
LDLLDIGVAARTLSKTVFFPKVLFPMYLPVDVSFYGKLSFGTVSAHSGKETDHRVCEDVQVFVDLRGSDRH